MQHAAFLGRDTTRRTRDGEHLFGREFAFLHSDRMRLSPAANLYDYGHSLVGGFLQGAIYGRQTDLCLKSPKMRDLEWIKTLGDGRKVKFTCLELAEDGAFMTAQVAGNEVVYSVLLAQARNPLSREDVESRFKNELSKK